jgi:hypothetical protein
MLVASSISCVSLGLSKGASSILSSFLVCIVLNFVVLASNLVLWGGALEMRSGIVNDLPKN